MAGGQGSTMAGPSAGDLEEKIAQVKAAAEGTGLVWDDLTPEQRASLYRDYTGEEMQADTMMELANAGLGGTQAGNVFVADGVGEAIASLGTAYVTGKKKRELSKQKAQAMEVAGGLAAGESEANRAHQAKMYELLGNRGQQNSAEQTPPQGGPPQGGPPTQAPPQGPAMGAVPPSQGGGMGSPTPTMGNPGGPMQGGPPMRPGQPGAPMMNAPLAPGAPAGPQGGALPPAGGEAQLPSGNAIPKSKEEWMALMMRMRG